MHNPAVCQQLSANSYCVNGVGGLVITCSQKIGLYPAQSLKSLAGYRLAGFTSIFTKALRVVTHRVFYVNQSVNLILIPTIHTTYKDDNKTYKLITC